MIKYLSYFLALCIALSACLYNPSAQLTYPPPTAPHTSATAMPTDTPQSYPDSTNPTGTPTIDLETWITNNILPTSQVIMPNGKPFGKTNSHLLFEDQHEILSIRLPSIPPDIIKVIVTRSDEKQVIYTAERDFSVSDDGAGGAVVKSSAQQIPEGQYDQFAIAAPNFDGGNLEDAALANLDGPDITQAVRAITLGAYYRPDSFERYLSDELTKIAKLGANHVSLAVVWFMPNKTASEVRPAPSTWTPGQFGITHSEEAIRRYAREAHRLGLRADLSPIGLRFWTFPLLGWLYQAQESSGMG